jgi:hypothetical protein
MKLKIHETGGYHHCFGLDDTGTPVAYLSCLPQSEVLELCDLEVREWYRGRGYSKAIIGAAQERFGKTIVHTGGYTPDGLERIAHYFHPYNVVASMRPEFRPMSFVYDWEQMITA